MLFFITVFLVLVLCSRVLSFSLVSRFILVAFLSSLFDLLLFSVFFCIVLILFRYLIVFGLFVSSACYFVFLTSFYSCVVLLFSFRFFFLFFFHVLVFSRSPFVLSPFFSSFSRAVLLIAARGSLQILDKETARTNSCCLLVPGPPGAVDTIANLFLYWERKYTFLLMGRCMCLDGGGKEGGRRARGRERKREGEG